MARSKAKSQLRERRSFSEEFKQEAVQMLLDGHSATSVADRLGLSSSKITPLGVKHVEGNVLKPFG